MVDKLTQFLGFFFFFGCAGSSLLCGAFPLVVASEGYFQVVVHGLLFAGASLVERRVWTHGLQ